MFVKTLFCSDPFGSHKPDESYAPEAAAAKSLGAECLLIDHDALTMEHDLANALRRVKPSSSPSLAICRGWMMRPSEYKQMFEGLLAKGIRLLNDPAAYKHCHYLPESHANIKGHTPKSVWMPFEGDVRVTEIMQLLAPFGVQLIILKDFVKSQKHYWAEACFIPSAADQSDVERIVHRFVELQGDSLAGGLVFREFVEFETLTHHSKSGMPLSKEYRLFFLDGNLICVARYWEEGEYSNEQLPLEDFKKLAQRIQSRFFRMDIAQRWNGEWLVVELGDGQVAGLPDGVDPAEFYASLVQNWPLSSIEQS